MPFAARLLLDDAAPGAVSVARDWAGLMWVALYDDVVGKGRLFLSADDLRTMAEVTPARAAWNRYEHRVFIADNGAVMVASRGWGSETGILAKVWDVTQNQWLALSTLLSSATATNVRFDIGYGPKTPNGWPMVMCVALDGTPANVVYGDSTGWAGASGSKPAPDSQNAQADPVISAHPRSTTWVGFRMGGAAYAVRKTGDNPPAWDSRETVVAANVASVDALAIQPNGEPALLVIESGDLRLYERGTTGGWTGSTVWTNATPRANVVHYDDRGSVYVHGLRKPDATSPEEPYLAWQVRALGESIWTVRRITVGSGGNPGVPPAVIDLQQQIRYGVRPTRVAQGSLALHWYWPQGASSSQIDLYSVNPDEYPGGERVHAGGVYPTLLVPVVAEPGYRRRDVDRASLTPVTLAGEPASGGTFPAYPLTVVEERLVRSMSEVETELGYVVSWPRYTATRALLRVKVGPVDDAGCDAIISFLQARLKGREAFTLDDGVATRTVILAAADDATGYAVRTLGPGAHEFDLQLVEVGV